MTEAVVNGKDTRCLFINNGDDLLTLKKVVSKKSDKDDCEKQKNPKSKETNGSSELNGNHNKTDSINFDIDNTSSLEPNLEMDSDTDRNITIDSICTQDDQESENIDVSNDNSNEADGKNDQEIPVKCLDIPYSPNDTLDDTEYSHDLEDDDDLESNNIQSPLSIFNISSRAPLHSNNEFDTTLEDDILPLRDDVEMNLKKRKYEDSSEQEHPSGKVLKLWNFMKYPFQKITVGTSINKNEANISKADVVTEEEEKSVLPEITVHENDNYNSEVEDVNTSNGTETKTEITNTNENTINKKYCRIM